jgi:BTB/POZ domain-containing protein 9
VVQLAQPYWISSMRLLLWDCDDRSYSYHIETSLNNRDWQMAVNRDNELCRSWQNIVLDEPRPVVFVRIVGVHNTANEVFHCVHFECPSLEALATEESAAASDKEESVPGGEEEEEKKDGGTPGKKKSLGRRRSGAAAAATPPSDWSSLASGSNQFSSPQLDPSSARRGPV